MNATIQDTLLGLFHQVIETPDRMPVVPIDSWQEDSGERQLLTGFRDMLTCMQQSKQQSEQQLREKEEQYRSIFEATGDGLFVLDLDSFVVEANPAACRQLGYTYEEIIGLPRSAIVHPDYHSLVPEYFQVIQTGDQFQGRAIDVRKDGATFPVEVLGRAFTYKGQPHTLSVVRDITKQVQAEEQLREKEEQYRSIFEATNDALFVMDLEDGHIVEANPAACNIYGYSYEEFIGLPPSAFIHSDQLPTFREKGLPLIRAGGKRHIQGVNLRKDGSAFPIDLHQSVFTYQGKPHILSVMRDITKQVQDEQELREREEQYRNVFEASFDGMNINTLDGHFVEVNPALCRMFGYTREELLSISPDVLVHPDSQNVVPEVLQKVGEGNEVLRHATCLRKDGTSFLIESHVTPFTYKGQPHLLSVTRDITKQVQAEQQLREREEQYRAVFEASTDALIICDQQGIVVEVNPAACSMSGEEYSEWIGINISYPHPSGASPRLNQASFQARGQLLHVPGKIQHKDGTFIPVETYSIDFAYKGQPHILTVVRDITERVQAEQQLREKEEQYRSIFEATSDGVLIRDLEDGHVVEANPAACQMYGYSYEEFIGVGADVITHPDSLRLLPEGLQTVRVGHQLQFQGLGLRKDGTSIHVEVRGTPFTYKGKPHLLGVSRDITERVQAQQLLEQRVEERTRELASLLEISHTVASTLYLKPLVGLILDQLKTVVDYTGAAILTVEGDDLVVLDSRSPTPEEQLQQIRLLSQRLGPIWETITSRQPILLPDMRDESPLVEALRAGMGELMDTMFSYIRAILFVPLTLQDRVIGMLVVTSREVDAFTQHHATLAQAIANQAAIAIENARLYAQAQDLAALEERQKLARELHDSVSQALYGISLGAHAARTALDRDPDNVAEPLDYVLSLTEAALAEMRALIFELRPESLETEGLVSALTKQAGALQARHQLIVSTELCDEPDLPVPVKQELYRIAQEAMHNTVKHARASHVDLWLARMSGSITLEVRDDGAGFDTSASFPGHLGLHSMRERVAKLGGTFQVESEQGKGTRICVRIPGSV